MSARTASIAHTYRMARIAELRALRRGAALEARAGLVTIGARLDDRNIVGVGRDLLADIRAERRALELFIDELDTDRVIVATVQSRKV